MSVWERQENKGESAKAYRAFCVYRDMGPERSTAKVGQELGKSKDLMDRWCAKWDWVKRATAWDRFKQEERERIAREFEEAEIARIMQLRYAKTHYRVEDLNNLAEHLKEQLDDPNLEWLPDVKQIGGGEFAERVDIVRFNAAMYEQYRGVLDDIAKELGGRVKKQELTGKNGEAVKLEVENYLSVDDAMEELAELLKKNE